ncbi:fumarylacetoacetate hydrolase family protein [Psychrosphaera haliotis]|uniref:FAA hydrolase family protein n=1 Tax=Psychrosphaera haliotis TaxID=555083 RepID=A0A6N8F608_9GAMM|nr:FAA hydrolase family protein [Psychrosphaera haliotis]
MKQIKLDNKLVTPSKVVCIGRNYVEHIKELDNEQPDTPVIFVKPNSAISDHLSAGDSNTDGHHYEAELCLLISNNQISAIGFGLDLTKRELQTQLKTKGLPWERAKAFDGAAVFSDFASFSGDINHLSIKLFINNQLIQHGSVKQMIFPPNACLSDISSFMTLYDNDIIMTGTPKGVGEIEVGSTFKGQVLEGERVIIEAKWLVATL